MQCKLIGFPTSVSKLLLEDNPSEDFEKVFPRSHSNNYIKIWEK